MKNKSAITAEQVKTIVCDYLSCGPKSWEDVDAIEALAEDVLHNEKKIYDNAAYVWVGLNAFRKYSRMMMHATKKAVHNAKCILDFGAGIGASTIVLKQLYPDAKVIYYDISKPERKFAKFLSERTGIDITFANTLTDCAEADLVCASEVFERIENCVDIQNDIVQIVSPKYFSIANAFGAVALGHFPEFKVGKEIVSRKKIGRVFNNNLRAALYTQMPIHFWNNRPAVWELKKSLIKKCRI